MPWFLLPHPGVAVEPAVLVCSLVRRVDGVDSGVFKSRERAAEHQN